jgi:AAT family amino acid transporter
MLAIGLSVTTPPQAPRIFSRTTARGIPLPALLMTGSVSALCFGSSFIGSGELWAWLQNLVGVSNQVRHASRRCLCLLIVHGGTQIAWFSIGLASWRFRKAWKQQGRSLDDLKFRAAWTWPWGPPFVVRISPASTKCPCLITDLDIFRSDHDHWYALHLQFPSNEL